MQQISICDHQLYRIGRGNEQPVHISQKSEYHLTSMKVKRYKQNIGRPKSTLAQKISNDQDAAKEKQSRWSSVKASKCRIADGR